MKQLFLIAFRNLLSHGRRSLMLGGAIAGVTAMLVFLGCLSSGVKKTMLDAAKTVATGDLNVGGYYKITAGQSAPLVTDYKKIQAIVEKTLPDLDFVTARGRGWARLVSDQNSMQVGIAGVDMAHEPQLPKILKLKEGNLQDLAKPGSVLIFESQAKKLKVKTGDNMVFSVLTDRGVNNTVDVRVAGVAEDMGLLTSWNVFMPQESLNRLYQLNDSTTGAILIYLKDMKRIPQDMDLLRKALTGAGYTVLDRANKAFWMKMQEVNKEEWTGQKLDITTWDDEISYVTWTLQAIDGLSFLLTSVLLVIIAVGIMNSLWIAIRERTREIGTLRAIGMRRRLVMLMFVLEAFCLGVMGTAVGALLGSLVAIIFNAMNIPVPPGAQFFTMSSTLKFALVPGRIFGGAAVITVCCTVISLIPSFKAARMKPVTAISHVG
ncbi:MAG TPA: FtsX-like permease family protein [bacterium]|nr:FtsX-like permease family protein [bacterium]